MSKFKRVTSGLVGVAMAASMFTSMPFSAFAEDECRLTREIQKRFKTIEKAGIR